MAAYKRIIPCLDIAGGRVVKGIHFENLRDAGDPAEIATRYNQEGADEIAFLDIMATVEGRKTMIEVVKKTAAVITVPLTVGGGISSVEDMRILIEAGANKISINTAAVKNPELISAAAKEFGSQSLVVAIDYRRSAEMPSGWEVLINGGKTPTGKDAIAWAKEAESRGAGELLPTSIDTDGTKAGYDLELLKTMAQAVQIPIIASGGAGNLEHLYQAIAIGKADAVLAASIFHFREYTIKQAKEYLRAKGIPVNLSEGPDKYNEVKLH
ncbi:MAG: imidazole glycerol phosphate synthase subunit HisF [bacterium]|nr:imidazole glycerol phosphate synthase subunit HisF [bacterium]